ncbi:MAG: hypothetical protein ABIP55_02795 [Tepidisphaeraceae bacterium]
MAKSTSTQRNAKVSDGQRTPAKRDSATISRHWSSGQLSSTF